MNRLIDALKILKLLETQESFYSRIFHIESSKNLESNFLNFLNLKPQFFNDLKILMRFLFEKLFLIKLL